MILEKGEKLHLITRRNFEDDIRRHFAGIVLAANETTARIRGYVFVHDANTNQFVRRVNQRTRIISLVDAGNVINVIPSGVNLDELTYRMSEQKRLVVTDGKTFQLDINEFGANR